MEHIWNICTMLQALSLVLKSKKLKFSNSYKNASHLFPGNWYTEQVC